MAFVGEVGSVATVASWAALQGKCWDKGAADMHQPPWVALRASRITALLPGSLPSSLSSSALSFVPLTLLIPVY